MKSELTVEEKKWIKSLKSVLKKCPSQRLGFFTIGDRTVFVYDRDKEEDINTHFGGNNVDFCQAVDRCEAELDWIDFPSAVHSTAG